MTLLERILLFFYETRYVWYLLGIFVFASLIGPCGSPGNYIERH